MSVLRTTLLLTALFCASPSSAAVAFTLGDALLSRPVLAADSLASAAATQRYFDIDALLTLGALALAGGALAVAGHRPRAVYRPPARQRAPALQPRDAA